MAKKKPIKKKTSKKSSKKPTRTRSRKAPQKRATKSNYADNPKYVKLGKKYIKLSEEEAAGGGLMSGYKKVKKAVKILRTDPLDKLGISRRKFMKTRLGRRLLELSAKGLQRDFALLDDLIDRFKETRS